MATNITTNNYFNPSNKNIKIYECSVIATEQAYIAGKLNVNNLQIPYDTFAVTKLKLEKTATKPVMFGFLGNLTTMILIKVNYANTKCNFLKDKYITYHLQGEENIKRPIAELLWMTTNKDHKFPQMYLTNPSLEDDVEVEIMVANIETADNLVINNPDSMIKINDLYYNSIITNIDYSNAGTGCTEFRIININDEVVASIVIDQINAIEKINNTITIYSDSDVNTQLNFLSTFHADQAFSRISWVYNDKYKRYLTKIYPNIDTTSPQYVLYSASTTYMALGTGITFSDIINHYIDYIIDYDDSLMMRDGIIDKELTEVVITKINSFMNVSGISEYGEYSILFNIKDKANNKNSITRNLIVDGISPIIYYKNSGVKFNINGDGTITGITIASDVRNFYVNNVVDNLDGVIANSAVTVSMYSGITNVSSITSSGVYDIYYGVNDRALNLCSALTSTEFIDSPMYYLNSGDTMLLNTGITKNDIIDFYIIDVIDEYSNLSLGKYNVDCRIYDGINEINDISVIGSYTITFDISDSQGYSKLISKLLTII